jgi:[CysO sulfur-carrier protein]-S-L-cysteine hydrolase
MIGAPLAPLGIPPAVLAAVCRHARATFPAECCGYLIGPREGASVDTTVACRNAQPDGHHPIAPGRGPDTGFVIAGEELIVFARSFDGPRPARVVYHSHPNGHAYFSAIDRAVAASDAGPIYPVQHLVVGVAADGVREAALFAWSAEARDFVEVARFSAAVLGSS